MSRFEHYSGTSANYDLTRLPVGVELILGACASGSPPLMQQSVLDAGCGTGNYIAALTSRVGRIQGVELNPGMLAAARAKFSGQPEVRLHEGSILELPIESDSCNAVMVNFVLHHVEEGADESFAATRRAIGECRRVLAPGGTLIVQTCSPDQYRHGYWYSALIPEAIDRALARYIPLDLLEESMRETGLEPGDRLVPLDAVLQGEAYLNPRGPAQREWRDGDSSWALVDDAELSHVNDEIERMFKADSMDAFLAGREVLRSEFGQATFVVSRRPA